MLQEDITPFIQGQDVGKSIELYNKIKQMGYDRLPHIELLMRFHGFNFFVRPQGHVQLLQYKKGKILLEGPDDAALVAQQSLLLVAWSSECNLEKSLSLESEARDWLSNNVLAVTGNMLILSDNPKYAENMRVFALEYAQLPPPPRQH